jgi:hypothetical protein
MPIDHVIGWGLLIVSGALILWGIWHLINALFGEFPPKPAKPPTHPPAPTPQWMSVSVTNGVERSEYDKLKAENEALIAVIDNLTMELAQYHERREDARGTSAEQIYERLRKEDP